LEKRQNGADIDVIFALLTDLPDIASGTECAVCSHGFTDKFLFQKATQHVELLVFVSNEVTREQGQHHYKGSQYVYNLPLQPVGPFEVSA